MNKVTSYTPNQSDKIMSHRKTNKLDRQWSLVDLNTGKELVVIRTYWPGTTCYACVWVLGDGFYSRGAGKAGGGGYCKASAAIEAALHDAGFTFRDHFGGAGFRAIDGALEAIAHHMGLRSRFAIIKAHG